jgi:hypothetical protein
VGSAVVGAPLQGSSGAELWLGSAGIFDPVGVVASQEVGGADPAEHGVVGKSEGREQGSEHV